MPFSELFAALRWWAALLVLGMAATPLAFVLFQKLPDRGYAFVKMLGLLLVSYLFWILGSLGFLTNHVGGILASLALLIGFSVWLYRYQQSKVSGQQSLKHWLDENRSQIILTELVFAVLFVIWVWVRAQNPAITATEKPMEFAFLNSVGRSPGFPPLDPWLSGFAISYYYFGYVMTSVITRLALVPEPIAFNLGIAWLVAATATGAFGLVYNLLAKQVQLSAQGTLRSARILGLVAALAIPVVGNLEVGLEVAHANGLGSAVFWQWLDVRDLNQPNPPETTPRYETSNWWWWRSSRPIHEYHISGRPEEGLEPIAEFPAFSFVLGDMHPHVLALPFALLSLALALVWWLPDQDTEEKHPALAEAWDSSNWIERLRILIQTISIPLWLLSAIILGGLSFLNTWDVFIYLSVVAGAFFLSRWRDGWHSRIIFQTISVTILLLVTIILLYLPFFIGFRSQAGAPYLLPMLMRPTRMAQFLIIFVMPLWAIFILLIALVIRQRFRYWKTGLTTAVLLILGLFVLSLFFGLIVAISPEGAWQVTSLANELDISLPARPEQGLALGWGLTAVSTILPELLRARIAYPSLTLLLATTVGLVVMIWFECFRSDEVNCEAGTPEATRRRGILPFALLLIATGALLTLGPEFLYLRDNFGVRLNTIFKFYYQAWVMFGVAALFAIGYLWQERRRSRRIAPVLATTGYALAFLVALLFPFYAVTSRAVEYRGPVDAEIRQPATINGLAQVERNNPDEYAAILWLRENVSGTPVILEAVGGQYSSYGRISANTGLPTILGWAGHEYQWRGNTPEPGIREPAVNEIFSQSDLLSVAELLNRYSVEYIYVGGLESDMYGSSGLDKFAEQLDVAYSNNSVTIYRWQPQ